MSGPSQARGGQLTFAVVAFAAVTTVTYPIAHYRIFTGFTKHDDEGYILFALRSFLDHGWHYEGVNGYGPFYFEFWGALFAIFGIPVDHDSGRTMTAVVWLLSSLLVGLSSWRMTDSIVLGVAAQLSAFEALFSLATEPMHPGGVIVLLLSLILVFSCFVGERASPWPMALLGGAVMALIFIKVNVGAFAFAAVALICVVEYPVLARHRWIRPAVEVGFVALPLLLMSSKAGEGWARQFACHVSTAALAVVIAMRARHPGYRESKELRWLGGGIVAVGVTVPLALVAAGTSVSRLLDGVITLPLRFPSLVSFPLILPTETYFLDVVSLGGALAYWYVTRNSAAPANRVWIWLIAALSMSVGLFMAFSVILSITRFTLETTLSAPCFFRWVLLAFAWVALIEPPGRPNGGTQFARLLLPPLAVLQALHAFPIAGSQAFWSTLLLIPVGALCIRNGLGWFAFGRRGRNIRRAPFVIGAITATAGLLLLVGVHLRQEFDWVRAAYRGAVSLDLPGAKDVRVTPEDAANYRGIVAAIDRDCDSFIALPDMSSFYFWAQQEPPAGYDPTDWLLMFDEVRQQKVVETVRSIDRFCLIENVALEHYWGTGATIPPGPLDRYLHHDLAPIANFGDYQLLTRDGNRSKS